MLLKGRLVCVGCGLDEVRAAPPQVANLYELNHDSEQIVTRVEAVRWEVIVGLTHTAPMRVSDRIWQVLISEAHLEVEIGDILSKTRILDISEVKTSGITITEPRPILSHSRAMEVALCV